ncbi:hypothetical protein MRX96_006817 [Rhipicephalus microplus]
MSTFSIGHTGPVGHLCSSRTTLRDHPPQKIRLVRKQRLEEGPADWSQPDGRAVTQDNVDGLQDLLWNGVDPVLKDGVQGVQIYSCRVLDLDDELLHPVVLLEVHHEGPLAENELSTRVQGTSRPAHYYIEWDDSNFSADDLQKLSYYLCHTYRSVSIPDPFYYAHLTAGHAKDHVNNKADVSFSSSISSGGSADSVTTSQYMQAVKVLDNLQTAMYFV